ncbi:2-dehydropantoate 2-reductase [Aquabacterium sp.]|uniref:2-dehydropantoate 2-reductase n=1 Tax=Aquabacterium sp. TaxID=1872578 RepID=UPI0039C8B4B9
MGAGSIGCWLGGRLAAAGTAVQLVGRPRVLDALRRNGLTLTDREGGRTEVPADRLQLFDEVPAGARPSLVLLCVKSGATADAARQLGDCLPAGTPVLSMQNGLSNVATAQQAAPSLQWLPGMVPYNVAELGPGRFHRGTEGVLAAQDHAALRHWLPRFHAAGLPMALHADLAPVQWGKLLLNLNNAVNALSGLPLRAQLLDRDLRGCTAALIAETLAVLGRAGIRPAKMSPLPPAWVPSVLRLPTPLFRIVAARMLRIDDKARSSMADDLALGRTTEVDALQGEVIRLATSLGLAAPQNACIRALVLDWPTRRERFTGVALQQAMGLAAGPGTSG